MIHRVVASKFVFRLYSLELKWLGISIDTLTNDFCTLIVLEYFQEQSVNFQPA